MERERERERQRQRQRERLVQSWDAPHFYCGRAEACPLIVGRERGEGNHLARNKYAIPLLLAVGGLKPAP